MLHEINLIDWRQSQTRLKIRQLTGCVIFGMFCFVCSQVMQWEMLQRQREPAGYQQIKLKEEKRVLELALNRWKSEQAEYLRIKEQLSRIQRWERSIEIPNQLMTLMNEAIPAKVYLQSFHLSKQQVSVRGFSEDARDIAVFLLKLREHPCHCVQQLKLQSVGLDGETSTTKHQLFRLSFVYVTDSPDKVSRQEGAS